jgi:predicted ribosomally synthesized peptide with SipW-like signal peptide
MGITLKTTASKIIASAALVGTAAAVAGLGTYGAFTSTTSASQDVTAGTVNIALAASGVDNTLNVPVAGVLPGDKVEKLVKLTNGGNSALNNITLDTSAGATGSLLTSDPVNGLQLTIENCATAWTGTAAPYTCTGGATTVLASSPILTVTPKTLANLSSLTAGQFDNLMVTTALPASAPNTLQGLTSTIGFTFTATQRTATTK